MKQKTLRSFDLKIFALKICLIFSHFELNYNVGSFRKFLVIGNLCMCRNRVISRATFMFAANLV